MNLDKLGEKLGEEIEKKVKVKKSKSKDIDDPEEIREILGVVATEVPALIKNIFTALYDPEIASSYGQGIVELYAQLKDKGMPEDMVREIVMNFSKSFDIVGNAMKNIKVSTDDD